MNKKEIEKICEKVFEIESELISKNYFDEQARAILFLAVVIHDKKDDSSKKIKNNND